jgi:hypothetical protein
VPCGAVLVDSAGVIDFSRKERARTRPKYGSAETVRGDAFGVFEHERDKFGQTTQGYTFRDSGSGYNMMDRRRLKPRGYQRWVRKVKLTDHVSSGLSNKV